LENRTFLDVKLDRAPLVEQMQRNLEHP